MSAIYSFIALDPRGDGPPDPAHTLGIEVTVPALAEQAAMEALGSARRTARIRNMVERGEILEVHMTHLGEGCTHVIGHVRRASIDRLLRLIAARRRIPRQWRTEIDHLRMESRCGDATAAITHLIGIEDQQIDVEVY